jgi:RES domain
MQNTTAYSGTMYRTIPATSTTPLATQYSVTTGGRWNAKGSYEVLYTFTSPNTARNFLTTKAAQAGLSLDDLQPSRQQDLVILNGTYGNVADLTTDEGLEEVGLPSSYPIGFMDMNAYSVTQPIGATLHDTGHSSILTRSASATNWEGPMKNWAEFMILVDNAPLPEMVERIPHKDWL